MNILEQLGINHTYFIQLFLFVFTLFVLSQFVFKNFVALSAQREQQTKGSETLAAEEQKKSLDLHHAYESRSRKINDEIRTIFDSYRQSAAAETESVVSKARQEAQKLIEETRHRVSVEIGDAARKLKEETPLIAQAITSKLLNKSGSGGNV